MKLKHNFIIKCSAWFLFMLGFAGCVLPAPVHNAPTGNPQKQLLVTQTTQGEIVQPQKDDLYQMLPKSLYFSHPDKQDIIQVWRLSKGDEKLIQMTYSQSDIGEFDISIQGTLAFTTNDRLFTQPIDSNQPEEWVATEINNPEFPPKSPKWAPDGRLLAFGIGGEIWMGRSPNTVHLLGTTPSLKQIQILDKFLKPYSWSPDGKSLLIIIDSPNDSTIGILNPTNGSINYFDLHGQKNICCQAAWSPDSTAILVSNPYIQHTNGNGIGGLWWVPVSGMPKELIPLTAKDGTINLIGWPTLTNHGDLQYLYANFTKMPDSLFPYFFYKSSLATPELRELLKPEAVFVESVLWSEDGSTMVISVPTIGTNHDQMGPLLLFSHTAKLALPIIDQAASPQWGP